MRHWGECIQFASISPMNRFCPTFAFASRYLPRLPMVAFNHHPFQRNNNYKTIGAIGLSYTHRSSSMFVISSIEHWITLDSNNNIYSDHFHKIFETKSCSLAGVIKILIINYIIMNNYFSVRKLGKYQILRTYYVTILTTISVRSKRGMTGLDARIQMRCFIRGWLFSFLNCWIWDMLQLKF